MHLNNWKARRAGGRITVNEVDADGNYVNGADGKPIKIVGVDVIQPRGGKIIATDKDGNEHTLSA